MLRYGKTVGFYEEIFGHPKVLLEPNLLSPHSSNLGRKSRKRLLNDKGVSLRFLAKFYIFNGDHFWVKWTKKTRFAKIFKSNKIARFPVTGDLNVNFEVFNPLRFSGAITKRDIPDSKNYLDS